MASYRRVFIFLASTTVAASVFYLTYYTFPRSYEVSLQLKAYKTKESLLVDTKGCQIKKLNPFDKSLKSIIKLSSSPYICPGKPSFLRVTPNATVSLNEIVLQDIYDEINNVSCTYQEIIRDPGPESKRTDDKIKFGQSKPLVFNIPMQEEYIKTSCLVKEKKYEYYLLLSPIKPEVEKECISKNEIAFDGKIPKLNIIFLGIDSVSKLNFQRHFIKTRKFLDNVLKPVELHGYTKVGDNTFPNLVPLLTGYFIEKYFNESLRHKTFFDHLDFVWKKYSSVGYRTLLSEDAPDMATFNYLKKGFKDPPTDYFLRPFSVAVEDSKWYDDSKRHCFQDKMEMEVYFNYLRNFVLTMGDRPYFAFSYVARLTHGDLNMAAYADGPTVKILKDLHELGILENSILVFYSDHGVRFGAIRKYFVGKIEERMPFMFLYFPPSFLKAHPEYEKNLVTNEQRLTTPFDIHATISHLFSIINGRSKDGQMYKTKYGISLFNEIPDNRTCANASILPHWCTCQHYKSVEITDSNVQKSAKTVVEALNFWLKNNANLCETLQLDKILDARVGQIHDDVLRFVEHINEGPTLGPVFGKKVAAPVQYLITLQTKPGNGQFEGSVEHNMDNDHFRVLDDISRINLYGDQSSCINEARLRKFCYCKTHKD